MPLDSLRQDLRYGLRTIHKTPAFAVTVALTLGLGIGATTAIFTVVSGVLLRPLPFPQPERLVSIQEDYGTGPNLFIGSTEVVEWQKHSRTLSHVAATRLPWCRSSSTRLYRRTGGASCRLRSGPPSPGCAPPGWRRRRPAREGRHSWGRRTPGSCRVSAYRGCTAPPVPRPYESPAASAGMRSPG